MLATMVAYLVVAAIARKLVVYLPLSALALAHDRGARLAPCMKGFLSWQLLCLKVQAFPISRARSFAPMMLLVSLHSSHCGYFTMLHGCVSCNRFTLPDGPSLFPWYAQALARFRLCPVVHHKAYLCVCPVAGPTYRSPSLTLHTRIGYLPLTASSGFLPYLLDMGR
ncbi:hypothetical protein V6N13_048523 [Hibiscus sabdariffa]|uniref:Uncharacterized protein n=2 Tax=Hibiscus sabdariffa TaxID=183260 RepID=A0ABR1Z705_9ROSI